jgi:hypothetical protein
MKPDTGYPYRSRMASLSTLRLKRDGIRTETSFPLSAKRTSPFKPEGASVQSTAGSRGVRISVSNAGYTTFRGGVTVLATHSIRHFPLQSPSLRHRVPSGFKRALHPAHFRILSPNGPPSLPSISFQIHFYYYIYHSASYKLLTASSNKP